MQPKSESMNLYFCREQWSKVGGINARKSIKDIFHLSSMFQTCKFKKILIWKFQVIKYRKLNLLPNWYVKWISMTVSFQLVIKK